MLAYIKKDKWEDFKLRYHKLGFTSGKITDKSKLNVYFRIIKPIGRYPVLLVVNTKRKVFILTPMGGETPFMESHEEHFKDLVRRDYIEYKKSKFD